MKFFKFKPEVPKYVIGAWFTWGISIVIYGVMAFITIWNPTIFTPKELPIIVFSAGSAVMLIAIITWLISTLLIKKPE